MIAHQRQREIGSVRVSVHVPLADAERVPEGHEVRFVLGRVVRAEIDALANEPATARRRGCGLRPAGRGRIVDHTYLRGVESVQLGAVEVGVVVQRSALIHDDDVAIAVDAGVYEERRVENRRLAGAARHEDDRVGFRGLRAPPARSPRRAGSCGRRASNDFPARSNSRSARARRAFIGSGVFGHGAA